MRTGYYLYGLIDFEYANLSIIKRIFFEHKYERIIYEMIFPK